MKQVPVPGMRLEDIVLMCGMPSGLEIQGPGLGACVVTGHAVDFQSGDRGLVVKSVRTSVAGGK